MRTLRQAVLAVLAVAMATALSSCSQAASTTQAPASATGGSTSSGRDSPPATQDLVVGAAKVEITPSTDDRADRYSEVQDPLFARAIAIQSHNETAALVTVDAGGIGTELWAEVTDQLDAEFGIARENVMLAATHTHSAGAERGSLEADPIVQAVADALEAGQPARMGFGTGESYLNVNRNIIDDDTGTWWEGPNREGVSDKTVAVVSFETVDGDPIAVYYNYAMHAVTNGMLDMVSADYVGAASAYIEESLGSDVVAVFSNGAAGDQNPRFFHQTYELRELRIADYAERGEDISNAMPPGGEGLDRDNPRIAMLIEQQIQMSKSMGQLLGEEVLYVTRNIGTWANDTSISASSSTLTCPGRDRTDEGRAGQAGTYEDGDDVNIRLSLLKIGDLYLAGVDGEVFNDIGQRLIRQSPHLQTVMTTLTNGRANSGYIYSDEAAGFQTFEVLSSRLKPGCAEGAIVDGLLELITAA